MTRTAASARAHSLTAPISARSAAKLGSTNWRIRKLPSSRDSAQPTRNATVPAPPREARRLEIEVHGCAPAARRPRPGRGRSARRRPASRARRAAAASRASRRARSGARRPASCRAARRSPSRPPATPTSAHRSAAGRRRRPARRSARGRAPSRRRRRSRPARCPSTSARRRSSVSCAQNGTSPSSMAGIARRRHRDAAGQPLEELERDALALRPDLADRPDARRDSRARTRSSAMRSALALEQRDPAPRTAAR